MSSTTESLKSLMATTLHTAGEYTGLIFLDESYMRHPGPATFLNRLLAAKAYIAADSSDAGLRSFEIIGEGQCGTVWALTGTDQVLKVMKEGKLDQLWNDSVMHKTVQEAFETVGIALRNDITIPRYGQFITPSHDVFWQPNMKRFPVEITETHAFLSSRIFGLPLPVRASIVDALAPKDVKAHKQEFLAKEENKDCLVRIYLGRREQRAATRSFRLRNFDLTISEMEYLRLDTHLYASVMARALAILHWKAHVDANDVEFVLGSRPTMSTPPTAAELKILNPGNIGLVTHGLDFHHRSVGFWLLDFDQCQQFNEDMAGLELLKKGFWMNDPYYPRPTSTNEKDMTLWTVFKDEYLAASAIITASGMPKAFITAVEMEGKSRRLGGSIFQ
ncbi:MAG: hypothetical protein Q9210_005187 [Variospora velana]